MNRITKTPRSNYLTKLGELPDDSYWNESAYYEFTPEQIAEFIDATEELYQMCLTAVQFVIDHDLFDRLRIPRDLIPLILRSWENEEPSIYGRFDLAYDGVNPPKMLEFNGDTPGTLYESAEVQRMWFEEINFRAGQFNLLNEKILAHWENLLGYFGDEIVHFTSVDSREDILTVAYLRGLAAHAGLDTKYIGVEDIGWDEKNEEFVGLDDETILNIFKMYPWEWLIQEKFGMSIVKDRAESRWIEPAWKVILSSKGILSVLWKLFPDHKYLLPAYFDNPHGMTNYVEKPLFSREGANVSIFRNGIKTESVEGEYGEEGFIYQELFEIPNFDGNYPVIGSWIVGHESAGIGIRENNLVITNNCCKFVPHLIAKV